MLSKSELRALIEANLDAIASRINTALQGKGLKKLEPVLARIGRGQLLPHWYKRLKAEGALPNLDGKTVGSVVEMLLVAVLETTVYRDLGVPPLRINPARGVDLPDLDLGVKSPSENFCTSEPFASAYQRLVGSRHDVLVLLTDYQSAKANPPLKLRILKWRYLTQSQVADENLCRLAREHRTWILHENEAWAQKLFRFLAYVNQSDWRAKHILRMIEVMRHDVSVDERIHAATRDFEVKNRDALRHDKVPISELELEALTRIGGISPRSVGVIDAADNWVVEVLGDAAKGPNNQEWTDLRSGPLDGLIGISFALQWRFNFSRLFGE
jgi:hypothetical protein